MNYYIASGLENFAKVKELKAILDERGWEHTYDWTAHGAVWPEGQERLAEVSALEEKGVTAADVVIVLLPGGRGTHAELGMAITMTAACVDTEDAMRIVIYSEDPKNFEIGPQTCAFYHHPTVERFTDWDEMVATFLVECGA